jgi:acyl-coenzyme A synthetase/AMP-(fatty) acid ligase
VESVILELDNVQDVAVFGEPHNMLGNIVVAKILLKKPESLESIKKRVRKFCLTKILEFKIPLKIILVDNILHSVRQKKIRR